MEKTFVILATMKKGIMEITSVLWAESTREKAEEMVKEFNQQLQEEGCDNRYYSYKEIDQY